MAVSREASAKNRRNMSPHLAFRLELQQKTGARDLEMAVSREASAKNRRNMSPHLAFRLELSLKNP